MKSEKEKDDEYVRAVTEADIVVKTLRDEFAIAALPGIIVLPGAAECTVEEIAKDAYLYADAMLKAREPKS